MPSIKDALEELGAIIESADVTQLPSTTVPLGRETAGKVLRLIDALEDLDDVQDVYANFDIPDEVMAALSE
jgi:transcriptional/translational regulatory protein YebC/TACO1